MPFREGFGGSSETTRLKVIPITKASFAVRLSARGRRVRVRRLQRRSGFVLAAVLGVTIVIALIATGPRLAFAAVPLVGAGALVGWSWRDRAAAKSTAAAGAGRFHTLAKYAPAGNFERDAAGRTRHLKAILDSLPVAAYTCDQGGLITYFNQRAETLLGRAPALNAPADRFCASFRLFADDGTPIARENCFMAVAMRDRRDIHGVEVVVERPDGERREILAYASPMLDDDGHLIGGVNMLINAADRDRTDRALEEMHERLRAQQAEIARLDRVKTVGQMAFGLAHELNQPLASILNYSAGAREMLRKGSMTPDALAEVFEAISTEAGRAGKVIRWLRRFARKEDIARMPVDVNALVAEAVHLLANDLRQAGVSVNLSLANSLPSATGDAVQVVQVLVNLIRNATEAMSGDAARGKSLRIRSAVDDAGGAVRVEVADLGCGMTPEQLGSIFEPFYTTKESGMGIGLAVSKEIIAQCGGDLTANTNGDGGITMCFTLPLAHVGQ